MQNPLVNPLRKITIHGYLELVPGRGAREACQVKVLTLAEHAAKGYIVPAVSLSDNPGGNTGDTSEALGECSALGLDSLIHITCKIK
jgi:methylenetetrahydrofolate reductase (NADPH)